MDISFCMTAMNRPSIVKKTLTSFLKNIKDLNLKDCILYLNIDPLPEEEESIEDILSITSTFFKEVISRKAQKSNFTKAVNWCWKNAESDILFHLEDDWELIESIDVSKLVKDLFKDDRVKQIALRAYPYKYNKVCLSPSLMKKELYKSFVDNFDLKMNPEIQLRKEWINKFTTIAYPSKKIIIKDIGRSWMKKSKYKKYGKGKWEFNSWTKK